MGVLPLQFKPGESADALGLTGRETFDIAGLADELEPRQEVTVDGRARGWSADRASPAIARLDTPVEVDYYRNGGILQTVLRKMLKA